MKNILVLCAAGFLNVAASCFVIIAWRLFRNRHEVTRIKTLFPTHRLTVEELRRIQE